MKKLISVILLCAMLASALASCAMKQDLLDLDLYPQEAGSLNAASYTSYPEWDGSSADTSWYTANTSASTFYLEDGADLKGFINLVYSSSVSFEGKTVQLKSGINLGGKAWTIPSGSSYFKGTFDGDGNTIGNFTMSCTSDNQSLLGSIGGSAVVKNLKVEAGKLTLKATAASSGVAGVVARIVTVKGKTATVENVTSSCTFTFSNNTKTYSMVGGVVGRIDGDGAALIKGCTGSSTFTGKTSKHFGGVVGSVTGNVSELTITGCNNTGSVSAYECLGGILGSASACTGKIKLTITDCTNTGSITVYDSSTSGISAGIIGRFESNGGSLTITGCKNTGMVSYNGSKTGGAWLGGIAGYVHSSGSSAQLDSVTIKDCHNTGAITANRTSGGLVGFIQRVNSVTVEDCSVNTTMVFNINHSGNYYVGGLIGIINANNTSTPAIIKNCTVAGSMLVSEPMEQATFGGGLLGSLRKTVVNASDCYINLMFAKKDCEDDDILNVTLGCCEDSDSKLNPTNLSYKFYNTNATAEEYLEIKSDKTIFKKIGYQYRYNEAANTYDLRFVFGIDNLQDKDKIIGFETTLKQLKETASINASASSVDMIYSELASDGKNYNPKDFVVDYFCTYTVSGIPASEVVLEKGDSSTMVVLKNLLVTLTPFSRSGPTAKPNMGTGLTDYTTVLQKTHNFEIQDFYTFLPDAFVGAKGILTSNGIDFSSASNLNCQEYKKVGSYDQYVMKKTCKCTGDSCTCGWGANGTTAYKKNANVPYHYYIDLDNYKKSSYFGEELERYNAYHTWTFEVAEDGYYSFCFRIRLNGNDGSQQDRYALVQFDGEDYADQTEFYYSVKSYDGTMRDNADNHDTYLTGYGRYMTAGKHTITFRIPYDTNGIDKDSSFHIRDVYMVKSALPVDEATIPVPTGAQLYNGNFDTTTCSYYLDNTTKAKFDAYREDLVKAGFVLREEKVTDYQYSKFDTSNYNRNKGTMHNYFYTYTNADYMVHTYFCEGDGSLRVVISELDDYQKYVDVRESNKTYTTVTTPLFGMLDIGGVEIVGADGKVITSGANFGLCLVYRLSDGRFVIVDGGNWVENDTEGKAAERLYNWLAEHADYDKDGNFKNNNITIAAWLFTHHHSDHISIGWKFNQMYQGKNNVKIENYLYNFPDYEYAVSVPGSNIQPDYYTEWFPKMESMMKNPANNNLVVHTGFNYQFADLSIDILYTNEDMIPNSIKSYNNSSTIYKITLAGKSFLVAGDLEEPGQIDAMKMTGTLLESDFLQTTHHGNNAQIEFYKYIVGLDASGNFNTDTIVIWPLPMGEISSHFDGESARAIANRWLKEMFYKTNDKDNDQVYFAIENWTFTDFN
ncbi:MAG: hypothetical protein IJX19_02420 [Clostridia bacterium]|nr:hypothetical protein [Clostridia bacterium]